MTANQDLFDASIRHQVRVSKYGAEEAAAVLALLAKADRRLTALLQERLEAGVVLRTEKWRRLLKEIRAARTEAMQAVREKTVLDLKDFSAAEVVAEVAALEASIVPIEVTIIAPAPGSVWTRTAAKPFQGAFLKDWFKYLLEQDQRALQTAVQMGLAQGEAIPAIVQRVAGSKTNAFRDGTLAGTRRKIEAVVRTAVNHASNEAREAVWEANADIIAALRWTSTLDGRTTPICRSRDGKLAPVGGKPLPKGAIPLDPPTARPPAHWNCRSVMVAVLDGDTIVGERPYVRDTRTGRQREVDFRAEARRTGRPIKEIRWEWAAEHVGQVPSNVTYPEWLRTQPADFQDEVLGKARGKKFRSGTLDIGQYGS